MTPVIPVRIVVSEMVSQGKKLSKCLVHTISFKRTEPHRQALILGVPLNPMDVMENVFLVRTVFQDAGLCSISVLPGVLS